MKESALLNVSIGNTFNKKYKYGPMKIRTKSWMSEDFVVNCNIRLAIDQFKSEGYEFRENNFIPSEDAEQIFLIYGEGKPELDKYAENLIKSQGITPIHFTDKKEIENIMSKIIFKRR